MTIEFPPIDASDAAVDRAIASALAMVSDEREELGDGPTDDVLVSDFNEVLSWLPFVEIEPPLRLEARVIDAALTARPAAIPSLRAERSLRRSSQRVTANAAGTPLARRFRVVGVAAGITVALAAGAAIVGGGGGGERKQTTESVRSIAPGQPQQLIALAADPATRHFEMREGATGALVARAVVGQDGSGFVYDLALPSISNGDSYWLWLDAPSGAVVVGRLDDTSPVEAFAISGPFDGLYITRESGTLPPSSPGTVVA